MTPADLRKQIEAAPDSSTLLALALRAVQLWERDSAVTVIKIVSRWNSERVLWGEAEADSRLDALKKAIASGADLRDADLRDADLRGAYLSGAYLRDADLRGADLRDADLRGADLSGADLRGAYLRGADLSGADLRDADLRGAYLSGADLRGAYLRDADLRGADLRGAYLSGADLSGADLSGAYLSDADLRDADLRGAYLSGADLRGAYLRDADLRGAYLSGADLRGAYLSGAYLRDADLRGADLRGADLRGRGAILTDADVAAIKKDVFAVIGKAPAEVAGLAAALREGRINGSVYRGECACLVGTIANVRGCEVEDLGIVPNSDRLAERWFMSIRPGQTPERSGKVAETLEWIAEWQKAEGEKVST